VRYTLSPQVGLRAEKFGALAYHYGNRRLTFLNDDTLVAIVRTLAEHDDVDAALDAAGVAEAQRGPYKVALSRLANAEVLLCE
jgi:putative mycofactocin binding protein MftB